jgi:hypothetical protein
MRAYIPGDFRRLLEWCNLGTPENLWLFNVKTEDRRLMPFMVWSQDDRGEVLVMDSIRIVLCFKAHGAVVQVVTRVELNGRLRRVHEHHAATLGIC